MPEGNPLVGEVWEMQDNTGRSVRGVVADLSEHVITLVSFTGNRFRTSPGGLYRSWRFSQDAPPTTLRCNRRGCQQPGTMRFQRGTLPEWVCPRHLPVGVQASVTTESLAVPQTPQAPQAPTVQCPGCTLDIDPIEDARVTTAHVTFWQCPACNQRWGSAQIPAGAHIATWMREAVAGFATSTDNHRVTIHHIEVSRHTLEQLMVGNRLAEATPDAGSTPWVFLGFPIRGGLDSGEVVFHTNGAPVVREPAAPPTPREHSFNPEVMARILRANHEFQAAERRRIPDVVASYPVRPPVQELPFLPPRFGSEEESAFVEEQAPTPFVAVGQKWIHQHTGDLVEVSRVAQAVDGTTTVVHFVRLADGIESSTALVLDDFLHNCRPFTPKTTTPPVKITVEVLKDEEWEHTESGEVVTIDQVDSKRDLIIVQQKDTRRRSVPLYEFIANKWRKIVRRTSYDRLLDLEDD